MKESLEKIKIRFREHQQEHLFDFYEEQSPDRQQDLLRQLAEIDLQQIEQLKKDYVFTKPEASLPGKPVPPEIVPAGGGPAGQQARQLGQSSISQGRVAAFVVAGGQGTRLGYDGPKGCYPATPLRKKPLFQVFAEQIRAAQEKYDSVIPWYVMTSPANHDATKQFFRQNAHWNLDPGNVSIFPQDTMPVIDYNGKLLLEEKNKLAVSPDGHGGSLGALVHSGALDDMEKRGVDTISYFQVDNPLVHCIDSLFIGLHLQAKAGMSAKALPKREPFEKLGNFCLLNGRVTVIEYSDMPEELAKKTDPEGKLIFRFGSIAIHMLDREFIRHLVTNNHTTLPFHRAEKKVPFIDSSGTKIYPDKPNAVKLERFIFDAMSMSDRYVILETRRDEEFSPIKNQEGEDSLATARHDQIERAARWLESSGVTVPRDRNGKVEAVIEISPLLAGNAEELQGKLAPSLKITPGEELYLDSQ